MDRIKYLMLLLLDDHTRAGQGNVSAWLIGSLKTVLHQLNSMAELFELVMIFHPGTLLPSLEILLTIERAYL